MRADVAAKAGRLTALALAASTHRWPMSSPPQDADVTIVPVYAMAGPHPRCAVPRFDVAGTAADEDSAARRERADALGEAPRLIRQSVHRARGALTGPHVVVCLNLARPGRPMRELGGVSGFAADDERRCVSLLRERLDGPANTAEFRDDLMIAWTGRAPRFCGYWAGRQLLLAYRAEYPDDSAERWSRAVPSEVAATQRSIFR